MSSVEPNGQPRPRPGIMHVLQWTSLFVVVFRSGPVSLGITDAMQVTIHIFKHDYPSIDQLCLISTASSHQIGTTPSVPN